jgi:hypothetical protein
MPVDKAFEEHIYKERTKDEIVFSQKYPDFCSPAMYFYGGYQEGQKSLSPEVREVFDWFHGNGTAIRFLLLNTRIQKELFEKLDRIENLLAKE